MELREFLQSKNPVAIKQENTYDFFKFRPYRSDGLALATPVSYVSSKVNEVLVDLALLFERNLKIIRIKGDGRPGSSL
jgi:hypothetical protein